MTGRTEVAKLLTENNFSPAAVAEVLKDVKIIQSGDGPDKGAVKIVYRKEKGASSKSWFQKNHLLRDYETVTLTFQGHSLTIAPIGMKSESSDERSEKSVHIAPIGTKPESSEMKPDISNEWAEESVHIMDSGNNTSTRKKVPPGQKSLFSTMIEE